MNSMIEIYHNDCIKVMGTCDSELFDMILTDLPFNYQGGETEGSNKEKRYLNQMSKVIKECARLLKEGGNLVVLNNPTNLYKTSKMYLENGFTFRNGVPLIRPSSFSPNYHLNFKHNYIWFLFKGSNKNWYMKHKEFDDVWKDIRYQNTYRKGKFFHSQAIKEDLTERLIYLTTKEGDIILDPFLGSGTSAVVANAMKRNLVGIEISDNNIDMIKDRLESNNIKYEMKHSDKGVLNDS